MGVSLFIPDTPTVIQSPSGQVVITPGSSHTLRCTVTPPNTDITVVYRWTEDNTFFSSQQSILFATDINDSPTSNGVNGRYTCTVVLSALSISAAEPVEWQVGFAVVTVGGNYGSVLFCHPVDKFVRGKHSCFSQGRAQSMHV